MPYYTSYVDTLLVDGTDIQSLSGVAVTSLTGLLAPGIRRGSPDVIPGRQGQLGAQLVYDAYPFSIPIIVFGGTGTDLQRRAAMIANLTAAIAAVGGQSTGGLVVLKRRLAKVGGGYDTHTANGQFVRMNMTEPNFETGQTELQFVNLDGSWWTGSTPRTGSVVVP